VLTGEKPEVNPEVAGRLAAYGHEDFTSYVIWACERALERGLLPHSNVGVLSHQELARLREVNASMGLMLESISERLMETVHAGSPTKHPARRLETIEAAGRLRIPFTSGILVGIGESEEERIASLEALAATHEQHGHIQEVILQNYVPHPDYYGREVADIADQAARRRWSGENGSMNGDGTAVVTGDVPLPDWATPVADAGRRHPDPTQPLRLVAATRTRGSHRPGRPVRERRSHLA
jgi:FO synthase